IYGWYAWSRQNEAQEAALKVRWLSRQQTLALGGVCAVAIVLMTLFIDPVFATLTRIMIALLQTFGMLVEMPDLQPDAFPFWDSTMLVLSIAAMVLMTRKFVENWLLWVLIDVISVVIYAVQGVYAMSLEYVLLTAIAVMGSYSWIKSAQRNGYTPLAAS
ncbi:MAG: nicotinamide riboside transporter PnuC, partial [Klebsiella michiganensis]|nr:nicotinamide riboside transporter PnuC [Klebsiella michiganensis]